MDDREYLSIGGSPFFVLFSYKGLLSSRGAKLGSRSCYTENGIVISHTVIHFILSTVFCLVATKSHSTDSSCGNSQLLNRCCFINAKKNQTSTSFPGLFPFKLSRREKVFSRRPNSKGKSPGNEVEKTCVSR